MQVKQLKDIRQLIEEKDHFLILAHSKPDGDALGAAYGLFLYLQHLGKKSFIGIEEDIFDKYKHFIDPSDYQEHFVFYADLEKQKFDYIIILDCSTLNLLGLYRSIVEAHLDKVFVIDHHATSDGINATYYIDPEACSTCEIIVDFVEGKMQNHKMALALYMGIVFDTGQFRHMNTRASVFRQVASILDQYRVNLESVYYYLFENETMTRKKVVAKLIENTELYSQGKIAVAYLDLQMLKLLKESNVVPLENELNDLAFVPHSLQGVFVSVVVREKLDQVTFSFRSRCDFNVSDIAAHFGGGGHKKAAGLKMKKMSMEKVKETIIDYLIKAFEEWEKKS